MLVPPTGVSKELYKTLYKWKEASLKWSEASRGCWVGKTTMVSKQELQSVSWTELWFGMGYRFCEVAGKGTVYTRK